MDIDHGDFNGYVFATDVLFSEARFTKVADFRKAQFTGDVYFSNARFVRMVDSTFVEGSPVIQTIGPL